MINKLLVHRMPSLVGDNSAKSIKEINSPNFNFEGHFDPETIAKKGRWWVCLKTKPWATKDLMIIDSSADYVRSISQLDKEDVDDLVSIIIEAVHELKKDDQVEMIVVGANINPYQDFSDDESVSRLHIHVSGLLKNEIVQFEDVEMGNDSPFDDKSINDFKDNFDFSSEKFKSYELGVCLDELDFDEAGIVEALRLICSKTEKTLAKIRGNGYRFLSYSFAIRIMEGKTKVYVSPKSCNGRGVLESFGVLLNRDEQMKASEEFIKQRDDFLKKVKNKLLKYPEVVAGKAKLEA